MGGYYERADNVDGTYSQLVKLTGSKITEGIADFRLNQEGILLGSAARTANTTSPIQTNYNARGILLHLVVGTSSGTGGLQVTVHGIDPVSGTTMRINVGPTAIIANGVTSYVIYPGLAVLNNNFNQVVNAVLPRRWMVTVLHGDATSYTYSVGYSLIL